MGPDRKKISQKRKVKGQTKTGRPLPPALRRRFEAQLGEDLQKVRIIEGEVAERVVRTQGVKALSFRDEIFLGQEAREQKKEKILAHEVIHVIQQRKSQVAPQALRPRGSLTAAEREAQLLGAFLAADLGPVRVKQPAFGPLGFEEPKGGASSQIPSFEIKGQNHFKPPEPIAQKIVEAGREGFEVALHYGKLARGLIHIRATDHGPEGPIFSSRETGILPLRRELLPGVPLALLIHLRRNRITGYLGIKESQGFRPLRHINQRYLKDYPQLFGLPAMDLLRGIRVENRLKDGILNFAIKDVRFRLLKAFKGRLSLELKDESLLLTEAQAQMAIQGLFETKVDFHRAKDGFLEGETQAEVNLGAPARGKVDLRWDREGLSGKGQISYRNEKFSGKIAVFVFSKDKTRELLEAKNIPARDLKKKFGILAEGDLTFSFTDWLSGTAHVVIDPFGHLTVIGEITPQREFELFPQKTFRKPLPRLEARARYGLPVVGNIFIFIGVGLELWAMMGPGKFYNIQISGTYSTDPQVAKNFEIQGSINISAAAGLDVRAEGGAGLEILAHDIKAGVGLTGRAGVKGYAEAVPIIGYREPTPEKKGQFFIRGELEMAAQPFLGLGGDVFIKVDSPLLSPLPDKTWRWPLFNRQWPLPGTLGIKAQVEYVFGSKSWPRIEFGQVDFNPTKFMSDIMAKRTQKGRGSPKKVRGRWREKNQHALRPPETRDSKSPGLKEGLPKAPEPWSLSRKARSRIRRRLPRKKRPHTTFEPPQKTSRRFAPKGAEVERADRRGEAVEAVKKTLARLPKPADRGRLKQELKRLKKRYGFQILRAHFAYKLAHIYAEMSPGLDLGTIPLRPFKTWGTVKVGKRLVSYEYRQDSQRGGRLIFTSLLLPRAKYEIPYIRKKYTAKAINANLLKPLSPRKDQQRRKWCEKVSPIDLGKRLDELERLDLKRGLDPELARKRSQKIISRGLHKIPIWSKTGNFFPQVKQNFDVDHLIELQLGGPDTLDNYILLHFSANRSSGIVFRNYLYSLRTEAKEKVEKKLQEEEKGIKVEALWLRKRAGQPPEIGGGRVGRRPIWTKTQIQAGEHLLVLRDNPNLYQKVVETSGSKTCPL
ncbi:eCIS core domain-containing protein [Thermosulfuriphilus sp.]